MHKLSYITGLLCLSLFLLSVTCQAEALNNESPEDVATRLQLRYDGMESLLFNFFQDTRGEMTGRPRKGSGKAVFHKKDGIGKMRWDYFSPEKQVLLSDGVHFSMYFSNLQQMIISPATTLDQDLTYSFFTGRGNLIRDFNILPRDEEFKSDDETDSKIIKLIPKTAQSQVQDIHLWVSTDSLIRRIKIRDHFGTITVLSLSDIMVDSLTENTQAELTSLFSFTPPEGTEIIEQ